MAFPHTTLELSPDGNLPEGIHSVSLRDMIRAFGMSSNQRQRQATLLELVVRAAMHYPTIKRVLIWGSFVSHKVEPGDLDYSVIVSVDHRVSEIAEVHRRFLVPLDAQRVVPDDQKRLVHTVVSTDLYVERLDFICHSKELKARGIAEIHLRGEVVANP